MIAKNKSQISMELDSFLYENKCPDSMKFTSIIVLTYNQLEYTKMCIDSIRKFTPSDKYELIIVDNASSDGTVSWLQEQSDLNVIYNRENNGFPKGCNQGIEIAKGENILLLNNDVIVTPDWLYNLDFALWSSPDIGAVGAVTNSCSYYQQISAPYNQVKDMLKFAARNNNSNRDCWIDRVKLIGFCMLIKKEVLDKIGVLDERFSPGNFEDDDISFRIIEAGYRNILCKDVFIHHFGSVSFKSMNQKYNDIFKINSEKFEKKWGFKSEYSSMIRYDVIEMIPKLDSDSKLNVLEVGCGTGASLLEVKSRYRNSNLYGIEISEGASKIAEKCCDFLSGDIEKLKLEYEEEFFDFIIIADVLEHLRDPWEVLKKIKTYLRPNGMILVSLPNVNHISIINNLGKGRFEYTSAGILDKTHLRFFTLKEMELMFEKCGYKINNIKSNRINITKEEENAIELLCKIYGNNMYEQYISYQYAICVVKEIDDEVMQELKNYLIKIDNGVDIEGNSRQIVMMYDKYKSTVLDYIKMFAKEVLKDAISVVNNIGVVTFADNNIELALELFLYGYEIDKNNHDLVYNLSFAIASVGELDKAYEILLDYESNIGLSLEMNILKEDIIHELK